MKIVEDSGFNLIYAKKCGRPKNVAFKSRNEVTKFFLDNLNDIEVLFINDVTIDINKLINNNKKLARYLKIQKITDIYEI
jgi:hypothetical protein